MGARLRLFSAGRLFGTTISSLHGIDLSTRLDRVVK